MLSRIKKLFTLNPIQSNSKKNKVTICAVLAVRNEYHYLKVLLPHLAKQNIDVVIIDHESNDESHKLYTKYKNKPITSVETLKYSGVFSLTKQLQKKSEVYKTLSHDWIVHHDADEILEHYKSGYTLRDAIEEAEYSGYNILNFEEFTFIPEPNKDYTTSNYYKNLRQYYFFEKNKNYYNRAWKRSAKLSSEKFGGHILEGDEVSISPYNHILRHYIILSKDHAEKKYVGRPFDSNEVKKGWHKNRLHITKKDLFFPKGHIHLFKLKEYKSKDFNKSKPASEHYWHWK